MSESLVIAEGLGKRYPATHSSSDRWRALIRALAGVRQRLDHVALSPIDLCVNRGESVAIVGENGAGKSTLLKLIAGVLRPTDGTVQTRGRVCAMLELGAGFQPEFTGRSNARLAAVLAGATMDEVELMLPEIIEFADIGEAIDQPVKTYSSGMTVRLGFAVNAALKPDLLITDEVMAVGDISFQKKCIGWLENYLGQGGTLLLVSHSLYHVQKLCQRACWLHRGRIRSEGDVYQVTQAYLAHHESRLAGDDDAGEHDEQSVLISNLHLGESDVDDAHMEAGSWIHLSAGVSGRLDEIQVELRRNDDTVVLDRRTRLDIDDHLALDLEVRALLPGRFQVRLVPYYQGHQAGPMVRRLLEISGRSPAFGSIELQRKWIGPS